MRLYGGAYCLVRWLLHMQRAYDVYGVGNALVDTEVRIEDQFLVSHGLRKGMMALVSSEEQRQLLAELQELQQLAAAGGSAANTMVGVALFGGRAFYTGKVGKDMPGALYRRSMAEAGVEFRAEGDEGPTGTCLVLVTPDGERTMQTSLGSASSLFKSDISLDRIARSGMVYVEGYLWGAPSSAAAAEYAVRLARSAAVPVTISLSDPAMVQSCGDAFRRVVTQTSATVFCNEHEARLYTGAAGRMDALQGIARDSPMVFMTCGKDGSLVWDHGDVTSVSAHDVPVVDTTGAGDAYASGVLYGLTHGMTPGQAAKLGSFAAARVVAKLGPRLGGPLAGEIDDILGGAHPLG